MKIIISSKISVKHFNAFYEELKYEERLLKLFKIYLSK